jgi:hypothetical protein
MNSLNAQPRTDATLLVLKGDPVSAWGVRDLVATGFHHKKKLAFVFFGILLLGVLAGLFLPRQ